MITNRFVHTIADQYCTLTLKGLFCSIGKEVVAWFGYTGSQRLCMQNRLVAIPMPLGLSKEAGKQLIANFAIYGAVD